MSISVCSLFNSKIERMRYYTLHIHIHFSTYIILIWFSQSSFEFRIILDEISGLLLARLPSHQYIQFSIICNALAFFIANNINVVFLGFNTKSLVLNHTDIINDILFISTFILEE